MCKTLAVTERLKIGLFYNFLRTFSDIDRQIAELNKQKGLLEPRIDFTSQLQDITQVQGHLLFLIITCDAHTLVHQTPGFILVLQPFVLCLCQ